MFKAIFDFIKSNFEKMPKPIQVGTYILFVVSFFILLFAPRYIDVRLVSSIEGDEFPIIDAKIEVQSKERILNMITDEKGRFSVPIGFGSLISNLTFILYPESDSGRQIDINVWGAIAFLEWNKLTYRQETGTYEFASQTQFHLTNSAFAQESISTNEIQNDIKQTVIQSISKSKNRTSNQISLNMTLYNELRLTNYDLSYINFKLKKDHNIDIWEDLKSERPNTLKDIIAITDKKALLLLQEAPQ